MIADYLNESVVTHQRLLKDARFIESIRGAVELIVACLTQGNKVLVAGNGGSAADAQHFAAEFVGRFKRERRGLSVMALTTDASVLTAWSNDCSFDDCFRRQIEAHGRAGDVFIGISTSGNSENVVRATAQAKAMGLQTIALLGKDGGRLRGMSDVDIIVPSANTPRIQEVHTLLVHVIAEEAEGMLL
ncbi:MAG: SIS domain-containing protein [bacterium]|nr:SIS domain-containing protein [bacterium]MDZ4296388.1 SIS domain-containing protein [Patescibacteria group bacterium]